MSFNGSPTNGMVVGTVHLRYPGGRFDYRKDLELWNVVDAIPIRCSCDDWEVFRASLLVLEQEASLGTIKMFGLLLFHVILVFWFRRLDKLVQTIQCLHDMFLARLSMFSNLRGSKLRSKELEIRVKRPSSVTSDS